MSYQKENDKLVENFIEESFFKNMEREEGLQNWNNLEIYLKQRCNLGCKYCYLHRYGKELYPPEIEEDEKILKNVEILMDYLGKRGMEPRLELFSGEPLVQNVGYKSLQIILDKAEEYGLEFEVIKVPTNCTFILSEHLIDRLEDLMKRGQKLNCPISPSASIDGKYCEQNRPFKKGGQDPRDDAYYDRLFELAKKWCFGFHPMIYSERIEHWKKNWLWFQDMFRKYDMPFDGIYLLEIRNEEWRVDQIKEFGKFLKFLIRWTFENPMNYSKNRMEEFVFDGRAYNILGSIWSSVGRGLGCSIQSTLDVRIGDLTICPCHRTSYSQFNEARFKVKNEEIIGIEALNPAFLVAEESLNAKDFPLCEQCVIRDLCNQGCLGSQYESTGDPFSPIPSVCQMEHEKVLSQIEAYKEMGMFEQFYKRASAKKKMDFDALEVILNERERS